VRVEKREKRRGKREEVGFRDRVFEVKLENGRA
jgi:hypothetical protein